MFLILTAALCSVAVSILLKQFNAKGFATLQMLVWNYVSAMVLCFLWFKPNLAQVFVASSHTPWWLIATLGILFPAVFMFLVQSLQYAGMMKTEIAQRLSVVLSLLAAYFIFNETFTALKFAGIVLGVFAVLCLLIAKNTAQNATSAKGMAFLALVWIGYAGVDILLKYNSSLGKSFTLSLNLIFIVAFVLTTLAQIFFSKTTWQFKNLPAGVLLGGLNFANIALYIQAHQQLKDSPAIVFMLMNMSVVILGIIAGMGIFKEKPSRLTLVGLAMGIFGVLCLANTMA
ncbi:DMT family transporter [Acinetobacter sp. MD2]|uniref:DMT family transporter n=1 Tax=Acinetobacter sp. MD2 TaxID=2600066 RepID=UPI002D1E9AF6|nr:DMT family transporter [Acinetobacter sp. MD2]MEB3766706.1 DMT family transporter [Acinetobacter sp. MD2]